MRLLERRSDGEFSLTKDLTSNLPPYAVLSHTWGKDDEEVTFRDFIDDAYKSKAGYGKIRFCGEQTAKDGLQFFWVDTCCIDKSSSAELTEAINSMFRWYREATKCYVYLSDVSAQDDRDVYPPLSFRKSRWFTRGWTLQELLAPVWVEFFSSEGKRLGNKRSLETQVHEITGINIQALRGNPLSNFSIAERMSWAAKRQTTRKEDEAYCLFGIFEICLPLIYGERDLAFKRLKDEITKKSHSNLDLISRNIEQSIDQEARFDQRLSIIHQSILETYHAVLSNANSAPLVSPVNSLVDEYTSISNHRRALQSLPSRSFLDSAIQNTTFAGNLCAYTPGKIAGSSQTETGSKSELGETRPKSDAYDGRTHKLSESIILSRPTSLFETLSSFMPELYAVDKRLPLYSLIATSCYQESSFGQCRTNVYRFLYLKESRQWCTVNISIRIYRSSVFWAVTQLPQIVWQSHAMYSAEAAVPSLLLSQLRTMLSCSGELDKDVHFNYTLPNDRLIQNQDFGTQVSAQPTIIDFPVSHQDIITFLDDMGCPFYFEKEVTQIVMIESPNHFASCFKGILVYETKFTRSTPSIEDIYNIELLCAMRGKSEFVQLVGVVVDDTRRKLKSYLVCLPRTRWNTLYSELAYTQSIPWQRRESWARQIVKAVSEAHANRLVIGTLWRVKPPIVIDSLDRVQLWHFLNKLLLGTSLGYYIPPELFHLQGFRSTTDETESPNVTPKTDIFHLGMLLWYLAEGIPPSRHGPVCLRAGCTLTPRDICLDKSHISPIALPPLSADIPQYYQDIVNDCRKKEPSHRPAAWVLLKRFPGASTLEYSPVDCSDNTDLHMSLDSLSKNLIYQLSCDRCRNHLVNTCFHCILCQKGDFDICLECYNNLLHCFDEDHWLVEVNIGANGGFAASGRYHSSVDPIVGARQIVDL